MNESGLKFSGLDPSQIKGKQLWECGCWHDDGVTHDAVRTIVEDSQHDKVNQHEVHIIDASGKPKTMLFSAKPIRDESRNLESIIVEGRLIQDIVDARQALILKNEELDKFASVASHDMKEPLRMIASFMQLLEKNYGGQLDDKARQYIHFAVDGSKRMTKLVNELLAYARVNRDMRDVDNVDLNEVIDDVKGLLRDVIQENGSIIEVGPLPSLRGYPVALRTLFTNLVSNAIKYQPAGQAANIRVTSQEKADVWEIHVSDNGIGIADEYQEEIFKLFKRLHTNDQYPGTGLGLSTCKRIVEEHGGSITVKSKENVGSTFMVTLPKRILHESLASV
jgi:light-regulated signal transduction histidine kinase (bacteriophytochrome)